MGKKLVHRTGWHQVSTVTHWCPACKEPHDFAVELPFTNGAKWTFDGNHDKPTFSPSMLITIGSDPPQVCHYFLREGIIEYLGDCTHELKGHKVPLPDIPAEIVGRFTPIETV